MGSWYQVTKKINGRFYDYWQRTYRVGKSVKTENRYIGPRGRTTATSLATYDRLNDEAKKLYDYGNALSWDHADKHSSIDRYHKAFDVISHFQEHTLGRPIDQWGSPKGSGGGQLNRRDFEKKLHARPSTAKVTPQSDISPTAPRTPEEAIYQLTPSTAHLSGRDKRDYERELKKERMEDERIQYGPLKARLQRQRQKFLAAKRKTRGIKALNPVIAQALVKKPK